MLRVQTIQRSAGRSVVAAAAYRSGQSLADERLKETFDFTRKTDGIEHTAIIAPANAPEELLDREQLWNAVEQAEKRKDATPAQEILVALPHELTAEHRRELVEEFVRESLAKRGMIADIAIHVPGKEGDDRNHHAHILMTTRTIDENGFGNKYRGGKEGEPVGWHTREFVTEVRREWAEVQNKYLERHAPQVEKVSEKTLAAQGQDRAPTQHHGPEVTAMERRGERTSRGENNRDIAAENARLQHDEKKVRDGDVKDHQDAKWVQRPTDDIIRDMQGVRAGMEEKRDDWKKEREAIEVPKPVSVRKIEAELTAKEAKAHAQARRKEEEEKERARAAGMSAKQVAQWYKSPDQAAMNALKKWHAELDRMAAARREVQETKRALEAKRAWVKSEPGRAHIQNLRQPDIDAAKAAQTERRTMERKIARMEKRMQDADMAILRVRVAKRLGHEQLRVPPVVSKEAGEFNRNFKRHFELNGAHARSIVNKAPEQDVRAARLFVRKLKPDDPVPSIKQAPPQADRTPQPPTSAPQQRDYER
jgi:hypothetical protein